MPTLPTICRVVYDTDPPIPDPDDDPLVPYRFSFLKSYSSSNFFGRFGEGHHRRRRNIRHVTDSQVSASDQDRGHPKGKPVGERFLHPGDGSRNDAYGLDLSRWITEEESVDIAPLPLLHYGMIAEETDEKLLEWEEGRNNPTGSRKPTRLLWDPITNTWISQDPNNMVYLHIANGISLRDRGFHSNRNVLERRARFYPCMEKHLRSLYAAQHRTGANESGIWANQHSKRGVPSSQHRMGFPTAKGFAFDTAEHRPSGGSRHSSASNAIRGLMKDVTDIRREDADSARGKSVTSSSSSISSSNAPFPINERKSRGGFEEEREDYKLSSKSDSKVLGIDADDFISLEKRSGASEERSDFGGSDNGSASGSTRSRLRQRVRIDERRRDSTDDDEPEVLPDRRTIEMKLRQLQEKEGANGKDSENEARLRTLRERSNRQRTDGDPDEDSETDETNRRTRKQMQELEIDESSSMPRGSIGTGRHSHRISRLQIHLPDIDAGPESAAAASGSRHPIRRRPSWLQRMRRKQGRRGGILRQRMDSQDDDEEETGIDLRFEDYDWLAKYCILDPKTVTMCKQIFDEVDENHVGRLTCHKTMVALRASNYKLTDMLEQYMYKIMELTGYEIENGADYRLFSVLAALSQRITAVDDWMKCLINKMDMKTLEAKLFICKTLWECTVDAETNTISLDDLCVELRAGGVSEEHEQHVREKLQHLRHLDLLDFLTYVPLFIMIHESVVENPLDDRRYK